MLYYHRAVTWLKTILKIKKCWIISIYFNNIKMNQLHYIVFFLYTLKFIYLPSNKLKTNNIYLDHATKKKRFIETILHSTKNTIKRIKFH